jgi:hypothetical protein
VRSAYLALLVAFAACSRGGGSARPKAEDSGGAGPAPVELDPRCAKIQPRVRSLYQKAQAADKDKALADDLLAANVTMVMNDCSAEPDRVAPCVERADDAAELERTCLIPLDDEGAVDGDRLRGK